MVVGTVPWVKWLESEPVMGPVMPVINRDVSWHGPVVACGRVVSRQCSACGPPMQQAR